MSLLRLRRPTSLPIDHWRERDRGFATMRVTSPFARRGDGFHGALDVGNAREGDVVVAAGPGRVIASGNLRQPWSEPTKRYPSGNYGGLMIVIEHAAGIVSIYAHLASRRVLTGAKVSAGQAIGTVGSTGSARTGGAHLHFGIQAPAAAVPTGVATHATRFGLGLDVDPWPLITALANLILEEDDDMLGAKTRPVTPYRVVTGAGNKIRTDTRIAGDTEYFTSKKRSELMIIGEADGDEYAGSKLWLVYLVAGQGLRTLHSKLTERVDAPEPADCDAQDAAIAKARGAVASASSALGVATAVLAD